MFNESSKPCRREIALRHEVHIADMGTACRALSGRTRCTGEIPRFYTSTRRLRGLPTWLTETAQTAIRADQGANPEPRTYFAYVQWLFVG